MEEKQVKKVHNLRLQANKNLEMSAIKNVPTFNDKSIFVELYDQNLIITGENLNIQALDLESGNLQVTGLICGLRYTSERNTQSFFKKIFK